MTVPLPMGFALLHGAGLGGWIWRDVTPRLALPSLAAEFPDRGAAAARGAGPRFDEYVASLADQVDRWPAERVVVVAHSIGAVPGLRLAEHLGGRLAGFVAIGSILPRDGGSFLSALPLPQRLVLGIVLRALGTRPPEAAIRRGLCSDLDAETADEVVRRFSPESRDLYLARSGADAALGVPMLYVRLTEDREVAPALQDRVIASVRPTAVHDLASGHLPMLSRPGELAVALDGFARSF